jgi:hypothetical protein
MMTENDLKLHFAALDEINRRLNIIATYLADIYFLINKGQEDEKVDNVSTSIDVD